MKKLQSIAVLFMLFIGALAFTSCNENLEGNVNYDFNSFNHYLKNIKVISSKEFKDVFKNKDEFNFSYKSESDLDEYIINKVQEKGLNISYLELDFYKKMTSINYRGEKSINDTNLSDKTKFYFNELDKLSRNKDYKKMISLLEEYKKDYNSDNDLQSLSSVFSVIEINKEKLLSYGEDNSKLYSCEGDAGELVDAALTATVSGAITGAFFGSWLGPAGTAAGAAGGAILGGIIGSILNIGKQILREC